MIRMARLVQSLALISAIFAVTSCSGAKPADPKGGPVPQEVGKPPVAVTASPVVTADLQESVEVVGTLEPKFSADVKSEVTGTVTAVYVTEWVPVRKGDRLARLDTTETEAGIEAIKAAAAQAKVGESRARREYERAQQLRQFGLITPQSFDDAKSAVEAAEAATSAVNAQIKTAEARLAKSFISSPIDGVVALRAVNVGDRVENMGGNSPLFRIVDNRILDLTMLVPSSRLSLVRVGQPIEFTTDALPGRSFVGTVMFINPALDEATRSARVVAEVSNRDGLLKGGAFVKGNVAVGSRRNVVQIPRDALLNWNVEQQSAEVFVVRGDQADRRSVKVGTANGLQVEVVSGLKPGEQVVTRGGFAIREGDRIAVEKGQGA